jgi:hypothetical protein
MPAKCKGFFLAHVPFEQLGVRLVQVHENEPIQDVAEARVQTEGEDLASQLQVMLEKDGDASLVFFNVGDQLGEIL